MQFGYQGPGTHPTSPHLLCTSLLFSASQVCNFKITCGIKGPSEVVFRRTGEHGGIWGGKAKLLFFLIWNILQKENNYCCSWSSALVDDVLKTNSNDRFVFQVNSPCCQWWKPAVNQLRSSWRRLSWRWSQTSLLTACKMAVEVWRKAWPQMGVPSDIWYCRIVPLNTCQTQVKKIAIIWLLV